LKTFLVLCAAVAGAIVATKSAAAQVAPRTSPAQTFPAGMPVRGVAYDSIRREPLRDAFVSILGNQGARNTTTDSNGRFRFDSVAPGDYTFAVQHAVLDSLGLSGVSRKATVASESDEVRLGVPSFATLWRIECAGRVPKDSGFVFGTVRDAATMHPLAHARVRVSWAELHVKSGRLTQRVWHAEGVADDGGNYSVCDLPTWEEMSIHAIGQTDSVTSTEIQLPARSGRIERRDLLVGPADSVASHVGIVSGIVTNVNGEPFGGARVYLPGMREVRTEPDGRFLFAGVPLGTQQIEVLSVGVAPVSATFDVLPRDTTMVTLQFGRPIVLSGMRVTAEAGAHVASREFDARRKVGNGYALDSTTVMRYPDFINVFNDVPGIRMSRRLGSVALTMTNDKGVACIPTMLLDGIDVSSNVISDLFPREVAGVEVYAHPLAVPAELLPPGRPPECGMVVVWTKYAFRNR
jgi:Carboxypeptidase regulatory-like domain